MFKMDYKNYLLTVLTLVAAISVLDRFVFALVLEPIKQDLQLSDTHLGLMTGIAFAAFYALAGIPIARWADRGNRITIAALSVSVLGVMVSLCGVVTSFFQLLLVRAGVAVGEAGAVPPAQSLLADYFDRAERPRAMGIYWMSYIISMIFGYLIGGWMVDAFGWRYTFLLLGIPAILAAVVVKSTLKEPRLEAFNKATLDVPPAFIYTIKVLWQQQTFRTLFIVFCVGYFFFVGVSQWLPTFFIRSHGMSTTEVGAWFAAAWGVLGLSGNYLGGYFASRFAAHQEQRQMRAVALAYVANTVVSVGLYLCVSKYAALAFMSASALFLTFGNGPVFAAVQSLVNDRMRSVALALMFLFANLIGFGLGPLALGVLSDLLNPAFGQESLRYALLILAPGGLWVAYLYWRVGETIEQDLAQVSLPEVGDVDGSMDRVEQNA